MCAPGRWGRKQAEIRYESWLLYIGSIRRGMPALDEISCATPPNAATGSSGTVIGNGQGFWIQYNSATSLRDPRVLVSAGSPSVRIPGVPPPWGAAEVRRKRLAVRSRLARACWPAPCSRGYRSEQTFFPVRRQPSAHRAQDHDGTGGRRIAGPHPVGRHSAGRTAAPGTVRRGAGRQPHPGARGAAPVERGGTGRHHRPPGRVRDDAVARGSAGVLRAAAAAGTLDPARGDSAAGRNRSVAGLGRGGAHGRGRTQAVGPAELAAA